MTVASGAVVNLLTRQFLDCVHATLAQGYIVINLVRDGAGWRSQQKLQPGSARHGHKSLTIVPWMSLPPRLTYAQINVAETAREGLLWLP